jgi:hypothetical protein
MAKAQQKVQQLALQQAGKSNCSMNILARIYQQAHTFTLKRHGKEEGQTYAHNLTNLPRIFLLGALVMCFP